MKNILAVFVVAAVALGSCADASAKGVTYLAFKPAAGEACVGCRSAALGPARGGALTAAQIGALSAAAAALLLSSVLANSGVTGSASHGAS